MKLTKRDFSLLAIIIYFTFIGGTFYSQLNPFFRVANEIIVTVLLGGWLAVRLRRGDGLPRTPLDVAVALYLAANLLSALLGQSPRYSLEMVWFSLAHVLAFYWLVDLARRGRVPQLAWAFYMASAVVCLVGLAEFVAWYSGASLVGAFSIGWPEIGGWRHPIPPQIYRLNITLNGATPLSNYLALLIPPAIGLILTLPRRSENRRALWLWLALAVPVQILTFSRAGILALGVSLAILAVGWWRVTRPGRAGLPQRWRQLSRSAQIAAALALAGLLAAGLLWLTASFSNRQGSTDFRRQMWGAAAQIFAEQPLTGAGPWNFGRAVLRLNNPDLPRRQMFSAHNIYLNTAAELGLAGVLAGGYFIVLLALAWRRHWRQLTDPAAKIRLLAVGASLAGLAAQLLVDTYHATPNVLLASALMAFVVAPLTVDKSSRLGRWPARLALAMLALWLAAFLVLGWADWQFQRSYFAERRGDLPAAVGLAADSARLDPAFSLRGFRRARLEARQSRQQNNDPALRRAAIAHLQTALAQEPVLGRNSADLAALLWADGQQAEALALLRQTLAVQDAARYRLNLGLWLEQSGDWPAAVAEYGAVLRQSPQLAASPFWQAEPARAARWPEIAAAAEASAESPAAVAVNLALARGEPDAAAARLPADISPEDDALRAAAFDVYLQTGQTAAARALLPDSPQSGPDYLQWGRLALADSAGDVAQAEQWLKTAVFLGQRGANFYLGRLYERQGNPEAALAAYRQALLFATPENISVILYNRLAPDDPVPQLAKITGAPQLQAGLALARLYRQLGRPDNAAQVLGALAAQDDYFSAEAAGE